jgi:glutamate racemase
MKVIGVFDSGFGGLTVLRELLPRIPDARYVYLGDTARLPYGSKSRGTIARYAISSAKFLVDQGAELLVIACNTATALAFEEIRAALPIPVIGVVEPGARAALNAASASPAGVRGSEVVVLATAATTQSGAYTRNLTELGLRSIEKACPLLVPLVEEGWLGEPAQKTVTLDVLRIYLLEALEQAPSANILLLGCTHYPLLKPLMETTLQNLHHRMQIIDSAAATAQAVSLLAPGSHVPGDMAGPECVFYATDSIEKFQRLGSRFLRRPLAEVQLIDLGG